ncbi:MAG: hypothetical protein GX297_07620 [Treponema sp.]|nr:hypothetical protein [Treponema sp.]
MSFIGVLLFLIAVISATKLKVPQITVIDPKVANPGDVLLIYGSGFGNEQHESFVEIGGLRITSSNCIEWSDNKIAITLPANVRDGLVYVVTQGGRSEPKIFTNKTAVPVKVISDPATSFPAIYNIEEKNQSVGGLLSIHGKNFGLMRNNSKVYFSFKDSESVQSVIQIYCENEDYEYWSDELIRVRVPDGASDGSIFVETEKGTSNNYPFILQSSIGKKTLLEKRTFVIDTSVELREVVADDDGLIFLRIPKPPVFASQPNVEVTLSSREPFIEEIAGTIVHQFDGEDIKVAIESEKTDSKTETFLPTANLNINHTFVVTTHAVSTDIKEHLVKPYSQGVLLSKMQQSSDSIYSLSKDEKIISLARSIIGKTTNPYTKAYLIYKYMVNNFAVLSELRSPDAPILDLIKTKRGDAYDFAMLYNGLLAACNVIVRPCAGILIDADSSAKSHWWCEFYVESFGWVPVDVALGAGLPFECFIKRTNIKDFYFGNLDAQHVTFSRDFNRLRPTVAYSKIVCQPKTYALQSIWEESSEKVKRYSSFWTTPNITGVY